MKRMLYEQACSLQINQCSICAMPAVLLKLLVPHKATRKAQLLLFAKIRRLQSNGVSPEEMAAEQLREQEVLMEWETGSSGTISAEEEIPIPVSPPMQKKPCHRQLPFDRNQSDREAAVNFKKS
ncbi:hypothetical protein V5799_030015 [Amblyomma americanum]|uniref:Uncharacterized protein n=1 Tax=Amblyomma americanum TaxID=6943 RepID=A0AAQ4EPL0_AMBAM